MSALRAFSAARQVSMAEGIRQGIDKLLEHEKAVGRDEIVARPGCRGEVVVLANTGSPRHKPHGKVQMLSGSFTTMSATAPVVLPPLRDGEQGCTAGVAGTWLMSADSAPQPDLSMEIQPGRGGQSRAEGPYCAGAPELAIEVSHSTQARDAGEKLRLYEHSGVGEYLIVRTKSQRVVWRELVSGRYREISPETDGILRSRIFPGLWLDTDALWRQDLDGLAAVVRRGLKSAEHGAFLRELQG